MKRKRDTRISQTIALKLYFGYFTASGKKRKQKSKKNKKKKNKRKRTESLL